MSTACDVARFVCSTVAPDGRPVLGIVARRVYHLQHGTPLAPQPRWQLRGEEPMALFRPSTDVLLEGSAWAPRPVTELETALRVGPVHKRVTVRGDCKLRVGSSLTTTTPEPFQRMPMTWERAYGGRDSGAERLVGATGVAKHGTIADPRNPHGCGFYVDIDRDRLDGARLPNLFDPDDPIHASRLLARDARDWQGRPAPAAYAPVAPLSFPRATHFGIGVGIDPNTRPSARACSAAPAGLGHARLRGDERVSLWHLHRDHELLEVDLPGHRPRLLLEPPGTRVFELRAELATVLIEPDLDRFTLIWAAAMPVAAVFSRTACHQVRHTVLFD